MWLDRFSHNPSPSGTPPPQTRSYSPAPQRHPSMSGVPLQLPRPGINPRSSSLSRRSVSNLSVPSARNSNVPSTKGSVNGAPALDILDPLKALEHVVGAGTEPQALDAIDSQVLGEDKPEQLEEGIDFQGLDLESFVINHEAGRRKQARDRDGMEKSVAEYNKERDTFEELHKSIAGCDEVLKTVETYLTGFRTDLVQVSAEIETLQSRSASLSGKLENRKGVEKLLGPAVEDISLSPAIVKKIAEGPIDEGFIAGLAELEKRAKAISIKAKSGSNIKAVSDLQPLLNDLAAKAVERIRDYLVGQIKALRSPSMNAQILQIRNFLKYKDLYGFLAQHHRKIADEICQAYVNTMRWYYSHNFSRYQKVLEKVKLYAIDKNDTIAPDESTSRRGGSLLSGASKNAGAPHDAFSLGRRLDILKSRNPNAISSYLVDEDKSTHYLETPFHAFNLALVDNASFEYNFISTFFGPAQSFQSIARTFASIFEPTFGLGQSFTRFLIEPSSDALGILLAVRINQHFAFQLQRRKVPAVDGYVNATNMLLWPRFQVVMNAHCDAVRRARDSLSSTSTASSSLVTSSSTASSAAASAQSTAPHPLTQRLATFLHALLSLSSEAGDDEPVANSLARLRTEVETYLAKMSKGVAAEERKRRRFLYNNYSLVCTILEGTQGKLAEGVVGHFRGKRDGFAEKA